MLKNYFKKVKLLEWKEDVPLVDRLIVMLILISPIIFITFIILYFL